jgi:hypothetical protein
MKSTYAKLTIATLILACVSVALARTTLCARRTATQTLRVRSLKVESSTPEPSPTPVDQKWQVFYGDIEQLEPKLHELNKQQIPVYESSIKVSSDGKRFVLMLSDDSAAADCDDCGR